LIFRYESLVQLLSPGYHLVAMTTGKLKSVLLVSLLCLFMTAVNIFQDGTNFMQRDLSRLQQAEQITASLTPDDLGSNLTSITTEQQGTTLKHVFEDRPVKTANLQEEPEKSPLVKTHIPVKNARNAVSPGPYHQEEKPRKVVLIVTNKRSGSSFVGEMFMRNPKAYYLFEPLFPFTRECDRFQRERIETLEKFSQCQFDDVAQEYGRIFNMTQKEDTYAHCQATNVCFLHRNPTLQGIYRQYAARKHKYPFRKKLEGEILSEMCRDAEFTVFKVLRSCRISSFVHLIKEGLPGYQFKIIHLLRDPRAIMSSRMQIPGQRAEARTHFEQDVIKLCDKMDVNLRLTNDLMESKYKSSYMRVRLEDITFDPIKYAAQFYEFIEEPLPREVTNWLIDLKINEATNQKQRSRAQKEADTFQTNRKSGDVINGWRREIEYGKMLTVQNRCSSVLEMLFYKPVNSKVALLNENMSLI